jgi:hypothetical protein
VVPIFSASSFCVSPAFSRTELILEPIFSMEKLYSIYAMLYRI